MITEVDAETLFESYIAENKGKLVKLNPLKKELKIITELRTMVDPDEGNIFSKFF